jgi:hypothetical protein
MKTLLIVLFLMVYEISFEQEAIVNDYVVSPPDRKIVWILNNDTGRTIYDSWKTDPYHNGFKPDVVLVPDLEPYRKKYLKIKNKNKKS